MKIVPDFSEASEEFEPLPIGDYTVNVDAVDPAASQKGNQMLKWKLRVIEAAGEYAKHNNRVLFLNTMLEGKGAFRLKDALTATLGKEATAQIASKQRDLDTEELLGKQVVVTLSHRVYEGKVQNEIAAIRAR